MNDTEHILVVDDDPEIRSLLKDYLEKNGFRVTAVGEGKAMWRTLEQVGLRPTIVARWHVPLLEGR